MKPATAWPWAIGAVLGLTVIANVAMLVEAGAPGAAQVEPDYYRRALDWDRVQAERTRSAALGWRAEASFAAAPGDGTPFHVRLHDAAGQPVGGASLEVVAIHNLERGAPATWRLDEVAPGDYAAIVRPGHRGRWELRVAAERPGERFLTILHAEFVGSAAR
jgi:nitrogen fixation protein FixH